MRNRRIEELRIDHILNSSILQFLNSSVLQFLNNMYKHILQSVEGLNWFDIVPTVLFFTAFVIASLIALFSKKSELDRVARLPLED